MSQFHSTVSRRNFMKLCGLGAAGAAALSMPTFHDLDELASSDLGNPRRAWYIKERDFGNPTVEIDWSLMKRFDGRLQAQAAHTNAIYYGKDRVLGMGAKGTDAKNAKQAANANGFTYRTRALIAAFTRPAVTSSWVDLATTANVPWGATQATTYFGGARVTGMVATTQSPTVRGEAKWTGTPEEASKMLTAALRAYGASLVGYGALTQQERDKLIFSYAKDNANDTAWIDEANWPPPEHYYTLPKTQGARPIVYENVDLGYETDTKLVIPTKDLWHVGMGTLGANEQWRGASSPGIMAGMANANTFLLTATCHASTNNFLHYLGYQMIGTIGNDARYSGAEGAVLQLTGVGEQSRQRKYTLTPEYGAPGRAYAWITDLPLAETKPIDAGLFRFCHQCHKCADLCPSSSISFDKEPSWESPDTQGKPTIFRAVGTKGYPTNYSSCNIFVNEAGGCLQCWPNCTFTVNHGAMAHQIVKSTIANISVFDGFFYKMGKAFGYGCSADRAEKWWDMSLPVIGQDTVITSSDGGYRSQGFPFGL